MAWPSLGLGGTNNLTRPGLPHIRNGIRWLLAQASWIIWIEPASGEARGGVSYLQWSLSHCFSSKPLVHNNFSHASMNFLHQIKVIFN